MADYRKKFDVPVGFFYQKIDIDLRKTLFSTIVKDIPVHNNALKFMSGYLNWDMEENYDYFAIYEANNTLGKPFVLFKLAVLGDRFSIQGFYYCVTHDLTREFFDDIFENLVPLERPMFDNIIQTMGMSQDKNSPNYWKTATNLKRLGKRLIEITKIYNPQIQIVR